MTTLFVYGTLRLNWSNEYALMLAKNARHAGTGRIRGRLFRIAHYPGLVAALDENDWVAGDLFEGVTNEMLTKLDEYEGSEYNRQEAEVTMDDGQTRPASFYLYLMPTDGLERISAWPSPLE